MHSPHQSIYILPTQPRCGSLVVAIGLMEMLKARYQRVAFFCPILSIEGGEEEEIDFMLQHFGLDIQASLCRGFEVREYLEAYDEGREERLCEALISKVTHLYQEYDFVLIKGSPPSAFASMIASDLNLKIAKNLSTSLICVLSAKDKSLETLLQERHIIQEAITSHGCLHLATFINRCETPLWETLTDFLQNSATSSLYLLPEIAQLNTPTLQLIQKALNATIVLGEPKQLQRLVLGKKIAGMGVENYLSHIKTGDLVIVGGDRIDIIMATLISFYAKEYPNVAGIILTGGITLSASIMALLESFSSIVVPILSVDLESYATVLALEKVVVRIDVQSQNKILLAKGLFDNAVDKAKLMERFSSSHSETMTPMMFEYQLYEKARLKRQRIVLPESDDERILRATEILLRRDIVDIILLGEESVISHLALQLGLNLEGVSIINPKEPTLLAHFTELFYEMRKAKGLTMRVAKDTMECVNYFGTMMVSTGMADGMVSGSVHTTAQTVRPALQIIKTTPATSIVSSVFFICLRTKVLVYGDCAINLDPTPEELAQIALSSADTAQTFGIEPRVAMLSYSTGDSGTGKEVEKVRTATHIAQTLRPSLQIEGPIQYDAAIDAKVAKQKLPLSEVAGKATVFIFPNLNTGNNTYKAVQRSSGALAIGPILQGLRKPINDLSRGCLVDDIVNTVVITAIQAQNIKEKEEEERR